MKLNTILLIFIFCLPEFLFSQTLTQTLKGTVIDKESNSPLTGVSIVIMDTNPLLGVITDIDGHFKIDNVPVGRYNIQFSYIGYQPYLATEIIIGSGKEVILNIGLKESVLNLDEITVKAYSNKNVPINSMSTVSAKQVSMEEANRYAGGFDDPARLVSSYAGAVSNVGSNGIVIRGNSPKGLLWRMEGIQIPNPNHFADYISLGGGAVTALSSQTMATSDFFTGAFPAEYGNGLSGVFDINMRTGNSDKREHTLQASLIGIDFASEGPFVKGKKSTYLFNYRYSTLGLISPILPDEMGKLSYQDLSFKFNFPTKIGTFSLWGIGAYDFQGKEAVTDSLQWESSDDSKEYKTSLSMGAVGLNYKKIIGTNTYLMASLAATENSIVWSQSRFDNNLILQPKRAVDDFRWKYTATAFVNHKFNAKHNNRTGFIVNRLQYNIDIKKADNYGFPLVSYVTEKNGSELIQFYSQSKITPTNNLIFNVGMHSQFFILNKNFIVEPRLGFRWNFLPLHTVSFAYGLHSQLEAIQLYFVQQDAFNGTVQPNKKLDFNKAHHIVLGYEYQIKKNLNLKIEPYLQKLYDIPVIPNSYVSTINLNELWDFSDSLVNKGSGTNIGLDITLERYLNKGFYYMLTASVFDSKYIGGDGIERNTKYNRNYVFNILAGKEWRVGKNYNNLFNINFRFTYMGGERIIPVDIDNTIANEEIILDNQNAYNEKLQDAPILSFSTSYRKNKPKYSSIWSFNIINALGNKDFQEYEFNIKEKKIEKVEDMLIIPNISYKIEF